MQVRGAMRAAVAVIISLFSLLVANAETYVVCVGIGNYADERVQDLTKTEKDARAISAFFKRGTDYVITITGRYATKSQIVKSLRSQFSRAEKDDKIVFYFSGHGFPGGFCPYEMRKLEDGLTYDEIIEIMQQSDAKDKFIFADACNSGAIRQGKVASKSDAGNIVFFLSSRGNEYSIESPFLASGYFTNHLLRGLGGGADSNRDRTITASELFKYVSDGVQKQTKGKQHPVMWGKFPDDLVVVSYRKK